MTTVAVRDPWFDRLRSCNECDAKFRMRKGTTAAAVAAGEIKSAPKEVGTRTHYYLDPYEAWAKWGPK